MATLIRLRSPSGAAKVYDPAKYDVGAMLKDGYTRAGDVTVAAHSRALPTRRQAETLTPAELKDSGATQPEFKPDPVHEPWLVSQIPNAMGLAGNVGGRIAGGALGAGSGALTLGTTSIPGAVVGQQVGGVAGGAAGGASGEWIRQKIDEALGVTPPEDPAGEVRNQAMLQGALGPLGEGLGFVGTAVGKGAMGAALRATPEAAQTAIREGITATGAGVKKILAKLGEYGGQMRQLAQVSKMQGVRHQPTDVIASALSDEFRGPGSSLEKMIAGNQTGDQAAIKSKVIGYLTDLFERHGGQVNPVVGAHPQWVGGTPIDPVDLFALKQQAEKIARPIYAQLANKELAGKVTLEDRLKADVYRAVRDAADRMLENSLPTAARKTVIGGVPVNEVSYSLLNKAESDLIGLKEVLAPDVKSRISVGAHLARRALPSAGGAAAGGAVGALADAGGNRGRSAVGGAALGAAAVNSPQVMSQLALLLANPRTAALLSLIPRGAAGLMQEQR